MVTPEDFKKKLGDSAKTLTDQEIAEMMELRSKIAKALFDGWVKSLKIKAEKSTNTSGVELIQ